MKRKNKAQGLEHPGTVDNVSNFAQNPYLEFLYLQLLRSLLQNANIRVFFKSHQEPFLPLTA